MCALDCAITHGYDHPQLETNDTAVAFTASVMGKVSFAITEVVMLIVKTG